jgi:hypothetical protein
MHECSVAIVRKPSILTMTSLYTDSHNVNEFVFNTRSVECCMTVCCCSCNLVKSLPLSITALLSEPRQQLELHQHSYAIVPSYYCYSCYAAASRHSNAGAVLRLHTEP